MARCRWRWCGAVYSVTGNSITPPILLALLFTLAHNSFSGLTSRYKNPNKTKMWSKQAHGISDGGKTKYTSVKIRERFCSYSVYKTFSPESGSIDIMLLVNAKSNIILLTNVYKMCKNMWQVFWFFRRLFTTSFLISASTIQCKPCKKCAS